jgi:hypothetical protein
MTLSLVTKPADGRPRFSVTPGPRRGTVLAPVAGALTPGWGDARSAFPFFRSFFVPRRTSSVRPAPPFREDPRVEADVSTQSQESQADPWFPQADEHQGGT